MKNRTVLGSGEGEEQDRVRNRTSRERNMNESGGSKIPKSARVRRVQAPEGREAETHSEDVIFTKVGREPNRFKSVFCC